MATVIESAIDGKQNVAWKKLCVPRTPWPSTIVSFRDSSARSGIMTKAH